jgi:hypothetical protein
MNPTSHDPEWEQQQLQEDLAEQLWPALLGELAGPMAHEFNNFLNTVVLEISVLEQRSPPARVPSWPSFGDMPPAPPISLNNCKNTASAARGNCGRSF